MTVKQMLSELYRKPDDGYLFGVIAGLCEYFGWRTRLVRIATIFLAIFLGFWPVLIAYGMAVLLLPTADEINHPEQTPTTSMHVRRGTVSERYERIQRRLNDLEAHLHSSEYRLRQQFRELER